MRAESSNTLHYLSQELLQEGRSGLRSVDEECLGRWVLPELTLVIGWIIVVVEN